MGQFVRSQLWDIPRLPPPYQGRSSPFVTLHDDCKQSCFFQKLLNDTQHFCFVVDGVTHGGRAEAYPQILTRCPAFDPTGAETATSRSSFPQVPKNSTHSGCTAIRAAQTRRAKGFNESTSDIAVEDLDAILARFVAGG